MDGVVLEGMLEVAVEGEPVFDRSEHVWFVMGLITRLLFRLGI